MLFNDISGINPFGETNFVNNNIATSSLAVNNNNNLLVLGKKTSSIGGISGNVHGSTDYNSN